MQSNRRQPISWALKGERGIETIEWIALAAVVLVLLMGMLLVATPGGQQMATSMFGKTSEWINRWTGGGSGPGASDPSVSGPPRVSGPSTHDPSLTSPSVGVPSLVENVFTGGGGGGGGAGGSWGPGDGPGTGVTWKRDTYDERVSYSREVAYDPKTGLLVETETWKHASPAVLDKVDVKLAEFDTSLEGAVASWEARGEHGEVGIEGLSGKIGAEGEIGIDKHGLKAEIEGKAGAYIGRVKGKLHGNKEIAEGYSVGGEMSGEAYLGAEASGKAVAHLGPSGVSVGAGAEAFVGGKAEVEGKLGGEMAGIGAAVTAKAGVSYGLGAKADFKFGFKDGKLVIKEELGLTVGLGVHQAVGIEFDVSSIGQKAVEWGKQGINSVLNML